MVASDIAQVETTEFLHSAQPNSMSCRVIASVYQNTRNAEVECESSWRVGLHL